MYRSVVLYKSDFAAEQRHVWFGMLAEARLPYGTEEITVYIKLPE